MRQAHTPGPEITAQTFKAISTTARITSSRQNDMPDRQGGEEGEWTWLRLQWFTCPSLVLGVRAVIIISILVMMPSHKHKIMTSWEYGPNEKQNSEGKDAC